MNDYTNLKDWEMEDNRPKVRLNGEPEAPDKCPVMCECYSCTAAEMPKLAKQNSKETGLTFRQPL